MDCCVFVFDCDCIVCGIGGLFGGIDCCGVYGIHSFLLAFIWVMSPLGRYSCIAQGASPGLIIGIHLLSPVGAALPIRKANARAVSAAPTELNLLLSAYPQGFISGFALISPWALQECRPFRALCRIGCVYPGFHIGLCPHSTLGYAGVSPFQGSLSYCLLYPQGFISGFALISPWAMQEYRPFRALCRIGVWGIVSWYCVR